MGMQYDAPKSATSTYEDPKLWISRHGTPIVPTHMHGPVRHRVMA